MKSHDARRDAPASPRILLAICLAAACAPSALGASVQEILPPPPPPQNFVRYSETEVLEKLPEDERVKVERERSARDKFEAFLDVSEMRLDALQNAASNGKKQLVPALILYEAVLLAADARLRSPEANVKPRDKRYKKFERRLNDQIGRLEAIVASLPYEESMTGEAVLETVTRLRVEALHSALDTEILSTP